MLAGRTALAPGTSVAQYALQCNVTPHGSGDEDEDDGTEKEAATQAEAADIPTAGSAEWRVLGEMEYAIRLCMLEWREDTPHTHITARALYHDLLVPLTCSCLLPVYAHDLCVPMSIKLLECRVEALTHRSWQAGAPIRSAPDV